MFEFHHRDSKKLFRYRDHNKFYRDKKFFRYRNLNKFYRDRDRNDDRI